MAGNPLQAMLKAKIQGQMKTYFQNEVNKKMNMKREEDKNYALKEMEKLNRLKNKSNAKNGEKQTE